MDSDLIISAYNVFWNRVCVFSSECFCCSAKLRGFVLSFDGQMRGVFADGKGKMQAGAGTGFLPSEG